MLQKCQLEHVASPHKLLSLHLRECHICYSIALWFSSHMDALSYNEVFLMNSEYSIGLLRGKRKSNFLSLQMLSYLIVHMTHEIYEQKCVFVSWFKSF